MRSHSLFSRRPSASFVVASLALFVSLGGVGYAAITVPDNSVGSNQLQTHAVTGNKINFLAVGFRKIQPGAVGIRRINTNQVQARVTGSCAADNALASINNQGGVTCKPTSPAEFGSVSAAPTTVGSAATQIKSLTLAAGDTFMVYANPQIDVSGIGNAPVEVDCTLSVSPGDASTTQTRSVTFPGGDPAQKGSVSLMLPAPALANGSTASVSCTSTATGGTPTTTVVSAINALQTASNG